MITHRVMTVADLQRVLDWAAAEGWNPGLDDAGAFHAADPEGFFIACADSEPIAAISVVNHTDSFAFLGLYLCLPEWRGRGLGLALWRHALAHAGQRCIGLDGVPAQQENYARSGFVKSGETVRYAGRVSSASTLRDLRPAEIPALVALEAQASGQHKPYLAGWFAGTDTRLTLVLERAGRIAGFATIRACRAGAKIGPFWAEDVDAAHQVMAATGVFGEEVVIDVPERSDLLTGLCREWRMTPGFATARMYRGAGPIQRDRLFSVATLELG